MSLRSNDCGYVRLAYAIIEQAVDDFRLYKSKGLIVGWKPAEPYPKHARYDAPKNETTALLAFLSPGGAMDGILSGLHSTLDGDAIRRKLGYEK